MNTIFIELHCEKCGRFLGKIQADNANLMLPCGFGCKRTNMFIINDGEYIQSINPPKMDKETTIKS